MSTVIGIMHVHTNQILSLNSRFNHQLDYSNAQFCRQKHGLNAEKINQNARKWNRIKSYCICEC